MADWYVRHESGESIGPVSADLLVRGIAAGKVPADAEVCEIGTDEWLPLEAIEDFQDALPDDGVQTRVIESPWFMDQTDPQGELPAAYSEDDDDATRVAPTPLDDSTPGAPRPRAPPPRPRQAPARAAPRVVPPPSAPRVVPPPSAPRAAPPPSAPRAAPPPSAPRAAPPPSAPRAAPPPPAPAAAAARYDEVDDDEAETRVAQAPNERRGTFPAPRPAAGTPAIPPAPPAMTPLPAAGRPARPGLDRAAASRNTTDTVPPQRPPAPAPAQPTPSPARRTLLPLILLIVMLALALAFALYLLARR